jgi:hypothetical protein
MGFGRTTDYDCAFVTMLIEAPGGFDFIGADCRA